MGVESTILSLIDEARPVLLRPGAIPAEDLLHIVGDVYLPVHGRHQVEAPGMLPGHYAPRTPIRMLAEDYQPVAAEGMRIGLLAFMPPDDAEGFQILEVLSATGDLKEAAANLFAALHRLDEAGLDYIVAESVPQQGIGAAINDRLTRAACADFYRGCNLKNSGKVRKSIETFNI